MAAFIVGTVEGVVVDPKNGQTRLHLRAEGAALVLTVAFSKEKIEELCEQLYKIFVLCRYMMMRGMRRERIVFCLGDLIPLSC